MIAGMDWPSFVVLLGLIALVTIIPVVVLRRSASTRPTESDTEPDG